MGMYGSYISLEKKELEKLLNGNKDFDDIESVETLDIDTWWRYM